MGRRSVSASVLRAGWLVLPLGLGVLACAAPVEIDVQLVDPCDQDAIGAVEFLGFHPRGAGIQGAEFSRFERVDGAMTEPIPVPLADDFRLVVTGHVGDVESAPAGLGVSARTNLAEASGPVTIRVPFALVERFYSTTDLDAADTCTRLQTPRYSATATYLPSSDRVLILGGRTLGDGPNEYRKAVESFDPKTGRFEAAGELSSENVRAEHTTTPLGDGTVLVAGGRSQLGVSAESLDSAIVLDVSKPERVRESRSLSMRDSRSGHAAVRLGDGRVLVIGGRTLNPNASVPEDHTYLDSVELYDPDPQRATFVVPPDPTGQDVVRLSAARYGHSATVLDDGQTVVVAGGFNRSGPVRTIDVLLIDGENITVQTSSAASLGVGPIFHAAGLTGDGRVLLAGGYGEVLDAGSDGMPPRASSSRVEMWEWRANSRTLRRTCTAAMTTERGHLSLAMVAGGERALFIGGHGVDGSPLRTAEIAELATDSASCFFRVPRPVEMTDARARHESVVLPSGEVLVTGGFQRAGTGEGRSIEGAEVFSPARNP
jgi:hypothetical protein